MTKPTYHRNVTQGTDEWMALRTGIITASSMNLILTPTLKTADNDKTRAHVWELAAQRINNYTEPSYVGDHMLRGHADEILARDLYSEHYEPVEQVGFITREIHGVTVGFSPDGVCVLSNGGIECKSRLQKFQTEVIVTNDVPKEHMIQLQVGLFVTGWDWIDYVSYCGGMPMWTIRVTPDATYQAAIETAVVAFDVKVNEVVAAYHARLAGVKVIETERAIHDVDGVIV